MAAESKKIIFVVSAMFDAKGLGGVSTLVHKLANELVSLGKNVEVIALYGRAHPDVVKYNFSVMQQQFLHSSDSLILKKIIFWIYSLTFLFIKYLKISDKKNSIFISTSPGASVLLSFVRTRTIIWENVAYFRKRGFIDDVRIRLFSKKNNIIVVPTKGESLFLKEKYNKIKINVEYIPDWVNDEFFNYPKSIVKNDKYKFMCAGMLENRKGFDFLINAIAEKKHLIKDNFTIDIYGDGPQRHILESSIRNNNLSNVIKLKGFSKNLELTYRDYDYFILSSRFEGFPLVLVNALASGLACIATNCKTGPSELIINNYNGILIDIDNIDQMYAAILEFTSNSEFYLNDAKYNAYNSVIKYSFKEIFKQWLCFLPRV